MKTEIRQKLFDYFSQEHGISLMDSDFNELEAIASHEGETCRWEVDELDDDELFGFVQRYCDLEKFYDSVEVSLYTYCPGCGRKIERI